ncbi:MAG: hypothetical protein EXR72_18845 [Myxococcales bacterium]|nr:hypothetical protein [Myxococcales bacterium]
MSKGVGDGAGTVYACAEIERFCDAYLDGEFTAEDARELERHLDACDECGRLVRFRSGFKAAFRAAAIRPPLPSGLHGRMIEALAREPVPIASHPRWRRTAVRVAPAAAAAALIGMFMWSSHAFSPVADDAISKHQRDLPIDIAGGDEQVRAWFTNKVGFVVRPPRLPPGAIFRGARLANMRERDAAYLVYDVGGQKVSVLVFDPGAVRYESPRHRSVQNHNVYLDGHGGYHVATYRHGDVGYAFTSDMDEERMIQLVSSAVSP